MSTDGVINRLRNLTVADVINEQLVTVGAQQAMSDVAKSFLEQDVSAAPVIDEAGRLVGILSATDFLRRDSENAEHGLPAASDDTFWEIEGCRPDTACSFMTRKVHTVSSATTVLGAARIMSLGRIHCLPVLDGQRRVVGMVSTMDITGAIVKAVHDVREERKNTAD